ncbi:MAG: hypothetical protein P1U56_23210, partial [Saprospiraceae bacterium]|nr:hypothetical protein [Saprospiraceae bacterium]
ADLAAKMEWIIDGNYGGTLDIRTQRADTIIYLDIPTITCLGRVIKRVWAHHGKVRPDMPEGCKERFDLDFLHYVATYNLIRRKGLLKKLDELKSDKTIITIKNNSDIERVLSQFSNETIQKSSLKK